MEKISLCTVSIDEIKDWLEIMVQSALRKLHNLYEIIICDVDAEFYKQEKQEKIGNVVIRRISLPLLYEFTDLVNFNISRYICHRSSIITIKDLANYNKRAIVEIKGSFGHALGLHECINNAHGDYIFFCDPDVIFYTNVDEIYLELMIKHNLNYVGCAHETAEKLPYGHFPYLANSLVKRTDLPDTNFLTNYIYFNDCLRMPESLECFKELRKQFNQTSKYLVRGCIPEVVDKFGIPPDKIMYMDFDTGSNLYIWAIENKWRWFSFLSKDCQNYKTSFYRSNCKITDRLEINKLIYHQWGRYRCQPNSFKKFQEVYKESILEEKE